MDLLLFGDQTADQYALLRRAVHSKSNAVLTTFLEQVSVALREETRRLPRNRREQIPDFLRVSDLLERYYEKGNKLPELESSLVTISQLAHYIGIFEERTRDLPILTNTRSIGLCTGLLAAAAVSCARSLSELIPLAVECVKIAFRAGACAATAKDALDVTSNGRDSWSTILTNTSEKSAQDALDDFHVQAGISTSNQAYISAVSVMAVTISGPPATTKRLFHESEALRNAHRVPIPVYAPYHAGHLYSHADIQKILDLQTRTLLKQFRPLGLIHSASNGKCHVASDAAVLVEKLLNEILREPVRWDHLLEETVTQVTTLSKTECNVHAFGLANVANSLVSALKAGGQQSISVQDHSSWSLSKQYQGHTQNDKIAIVGMAGRFPDAANHEALWDLLMKGLDVHKEVPKDRFDPQAHTDPSGKGKNKSHTPYGCFIDEPGLFDPRFFNMSPREAAQTDPMGRLALVTAYEALEMSGYVPNRTPSTKLHRIGTFYGQTSDDWREINAAENIDTYFITGGVRAFAPGRINYYFKFSGPSFSVDTACSSSLAAIQLACTSLWAGDCDTACAGGLNVLTNPDIFSGLSKGQFLSKTGSCKTYDNDADGYCRGDGCASVILKRYEDAVRDKDQILGSILATGTNHSAEAVSITHPHAGAQEFLYKKILADAGVDAHDVSYVEMHGTGTQAGDGIEMTSVTNAFAPPHRRRHPDQPLSLGAIKANIGHGEASSGVNALVKVLMMMRENYIPPNVGIKGVMNKTFPKDLGERNVHIPVQPTPFPRNGTKKRKIFLNNFSAAGGNTAALLEDGPARTEPLTRDPRGYQVITVTARAISSLKRNIHNLIDYLGKHPDTDLSSLAYTTTARRIQHNYRVAITVSDTGQVQSALDAQLKESYNPVPMVPNTTAFTFTGQGSQYTGLGQVLYQNLKPFHEDIDWLNGLAQIQGLPSFLPLLCGAEVAKLSPVIVQLGMSCVQVALARMWFSWGVKPVAVVGHSLGEYAALHVAGVISASDMVRLVGRRAELLVSKCTEYTHGMLAVRGGEESVAQTLGSKMTEVACRNGPEETVLCGSMESVTAANEILVASGFKSTMLKVPFAFHSAQVEPILEPFREVAKSVTFNAPKVPVLSPLTGDVIQEAGVINANYLCRHARETVDFSTALTAGQDERITSEKTAWIEIGAHPVCSGMVKASLGNEPTTVPSLRRSEDPWKTITTGIATLFQTGVYINFDEYHREFNGCHDLLLLPTYSFDNKTYWLDYHNNWCLTKGEALTSIQEVTSPTPPVSKFSTTSCQRIVHEELQANTGMVVFQTNLADPNLAKAVRGHLVNDNPLYPSSLWADQALTVADYLYKELRPKSEPLGMNVCNMEVPKPLVAKIPAPAEGEHVQIEGTADLEAGHVLVKFRSVTPEGKTLIEHAHCTVKYEQISDWQENWNMTSYLVKNQIGRLHNRLSKGRAHKVLRKMAYKLFKNFVNYTEEYRGMEEVVFDSEDAEATATVHFQADEKHGKYFCAPFWIDSLCHLSGFICNGTDLIDSDNFLFISHGWGSLRFLHPFSATKQYTSYVRMLPLPGNVRAGDVYVFDGDQLVGICGGLRFQQIPRRAMNAMLPPPKAKTSTPIPVSKPAASVARPAPVQVPISKPKTATAAPKPVKQAKPSRPSAGAVTSKVMAIVAVETDVDMAELVDDAAFENLGVDSLLSLTITAKLREELELDIPTSLFTDNETVGALKGFFAQYDGGVFSDTESETNSDDGLQSPTSSDSASTAPSTPPSISDVDEKPSLVSTSGVSPAKQIVAEEMGVSPDEIADQAELSEMGMDSLMSLTVLSALRDHTAVDLPSTFLVTNNTIEDIENALGMRAKPKPAAISKPAGQKSKTAKAIQPQLDAVNAKLQRETRDVSKGPKATSVLLQGSARSATKKLFLFPDGSGSATSYMNIPNLGPNVALYGMNCPFMKTPKDFLIGIDGVATLYIDEMKRRQPEGPYYIGGWSAGGVVAYEVACQLLAKDEKVEKLVLIDAPAPHTAREPLPPRLHHFFDQIGLLGTGGTGSSPDWLLPHFEYAIKALGQYRPQPIPKGQAPKTFAIWAREGVCGRPGDPQPPRGDGEDPKPMKWLLNNRTDFGDNGWAELLGDGSMSFAQMDGNHFTMTTQEHADTLGQLIRQGLAA